MDAGLAKRIQQRMASIVSESVMPPPMAGGETGSSWLLPALAFCLVFLATMATVHFCSTKIIVAEKKDQK